MIIDQKWNTAYHIMPPKGWLNDPNGLCFFKGNYHAFFQYRPEDSQGGGRTFWGHMVSKDLLHWEFLGKAIAPDQDFDRSGVYSGSALIEDERMYLFYTGNVKREGNYDYTTAGREANTVLVESEDGIHFGPKQVLMRNEDYPEDLTCHIRDPKVWCEEQNGQKIYYMVQGARRKDDVGEVVLFQSEDRIHWHWSQILTSQEKFGYMWECPDLFTLGGQKFLSICPQGLSPQGCDYANTYQAGYFQVSSQGEMTSSFKEWDRGFDFYAPQTFVDEQGRRILIGWMGMPDAEGYTNPTTACGWQHVLTLPRVLEAVETQGQVRICQRVLPELRQCRGEQRSLELGESSQPAKAYDGVFQGISGDFSLEISGELTLVYEKNKGRCTLAFAKKDGIGSGRTSRCVELNRLDQVEVIVDGSTVECYLNEGEEVFSTRMYTKSGKSTIKRLSPCEQSWYYKLS